MSEFITGEQPDTEQIVRHETSLFDECFADLDTTDPYLIQEIVYTRLVNLTSVEHAHELYRRWFNSDNK